MNTENIETEDLLEIVRTNDPTGKLLVIVSEHGISIDPRVSLEALSNIGSELIAWANVMAGARSALQPDRKELN